MRITFDPKKRDLTLKERGLDFKRVEEVFSDHHFTRPSMRIDYGEPRFETAGWLDGRIVIVVWTPRGATYRIISMRRANGREIKKLSPYLG